MSLQPQAIPPIPEETARVALAIFPSGNLYSECGAEDGFWQPHLTSYKATACSSRHTYAHSTSCCRSHAACFAPRRGLLRHT